MSDPGITIKPEEIAELKKKIEELSFDAGRENEYKGKIHGIIDYPAYNISYEAGSFDQKVFTDEVLEMCKTADVKPPQTFEEIRAILGDPRKMVVKDKTILFSMVENWIAGRKAEKEKIK